MTSVSDYNIWNHYITTSKGIRGTARYLHVSPIRVAKVIKKYKIRYGIR